MGVRPKPSTILLLDGDLKLYKRDGIRRWQATFRLKSRWVRVSTGHHDIADATIAARELLYKYRYMEQHGRSLIHSGHAAVYRREPGSAQCSC